MGRVNRLANRAGFARTRLARSLLPTANSQLPSREHAAWVGRGRLTQVRGRDVRLTLRAGGNAGQVDQVPNAARYGLGPDRHGEAVRYGHRALDDGPHRGLSTEQDED